MELSLGLAMVSLSLEKGGGPEARQRVENMRGAVRCRGLFDKARAGMGERKERIRLRKHGDGATWPKIAQYESSRSAVRIDEEKRPTELRSSFSYTSWVQIGCDMLFSTAFTEE